MEMMIGFVGIFMSIVTGVALIVRRFTKLEGRVDHLETRFDNLEVRFDKLEVRVDRVEEKLNVLTGKVDQILFYLSDNYKLRHHKKD